MSSVTEFIKQFDSNATCIAYLEMLRWGGHSPTKCYRCGGDRFYELSTNNRDRFQCAGCRHRVSILQRTIFDNAKIPLPNFFYLIYQFALNKKSISSHQVGLNIGISQKSAWVITHKLRHAFSDEGKFKLSGIVEIDEAFFSKSNIRTWATNSVARKGPIIGMIQRGGKVVVRTLTDRKAETIEEIILKYVEPETTIFTDGWMGYKNLDKYYNHHWIDHAGNEYSRDSIHTNSIEGFWGYLKKSLRAAHHSVSPEHLQLYLDQVAWSYNNRHLTPMQRFDDLLLRCTERKVETPKGIDSKRKLALA